MQMRSKADDPLVRLKVPNRTQSAAVGRKAGMYFVALALFDQLSVKFNAQLSNYRGAEGIRGATRAQDCRESHRHTDK